MPRKDFHDLFEKTILGKLTGMSDIMDAPVGQLHSHHRVLNHDLPSIMALAAAKGGDFLENVMAGIIHLSLDESITGGKKELHKYIKRKELKRTKRWSSE